MRKSDRLIKAFKNNMSHVSLEDENNLILIFTELILRLGDEKDFNIATSPVFLGKNGKTHTVCTQAIGISFDEYPECVNEIDIHDKIVNELFRMFDEIDTPTYLYQIQVRSVLNPQSQTESLSLKIRSAF